MLIRHGIEPLPIEHYKSLIGGGSEKLINAAIEAGLDFEERKMILAEYEASYYDRCTVRTEHYSGIKELLDYLDNCAISYAVVSNKPQMITEKIIKTFFPDRNWAGILGQRLNIPTKPNPAGVNEIISASGCQKSESLMIGDSYIDIETAQRAGIKGIGALWGYGSKEQLINAGASLIIGSPQEICGFIQMKNRM